MSGLLCMVLAIVALAELVVIVLQMARIKGLEERYWDERSERIKNANRHPFCGGVVGGDDQ